MNWIGSRVEAGVAEFESRWPWRPWVIGGVFALLVLSAVAFVVMPPTPWREFFLSMALIGVVTLVLALALGVIAPRPKH